MPEKDEGAIAAVTRDALYVQVWREPMINVAAGYDVSSSYLARICSIMNVPRPPRGYWAKQEAGKPTAQPALPPARPGDLVSWVPGGGLPLDVHLPTPTAPDLPRRKRAIPRLTPPEPHDLVNDLARQFATARELDCGLLKPRKFLLPDILTSKATLEKCIQTANAIYLAVEQRGHAVRIAPSDVSFHRTEVEEREDAKAKRDSRAIWSPMRPTIAFIGTVAVGLVIFETTEEVAVRYMGGKYTRLSEIVPPKKPPRYEPYFFDTTKTYPTGRLRLTAYSPYYKAEWTKTWDLPDPSASDGKIERIVREIESASPEIARLAEEGRRIADREHQEWEEQKRQWRIEARERKRTEARTKSRDHLVETIKSWARARRMEEFFQDIEQRSAKLPQEERSALNPRLAAARELFGGTDALKRFGKWKSPIEIFDHVAAEENDE